MNLGTGVDYTINDYYRAVAKIIGYRGKFEHDLSKPVGMKQKVVDVLLASNCGWSSSLSLEEGLRRTYSYYLSEIKEKRK